MAKTLGKKQTFSLQDPKAHSVMLVGDFTRWEEEPISLRRQKDGSWKAAVTLPPGNHHYRFLVDGEWRDDPQCALRVDNPFGDKNSVRQVV